MSTRIQNDLPNTKHLLSNERILRLKLVEERTGLKRSTIYKRISEGTFPKQISLGGGRAIGWLESEIITWISKLVK